MRNAYASAWWLGPSCVGTYDSSTSGRSCAAMTPVSRSHSKREALPASTRGETAAGAFATAGAETSLPGTPAMLPTVLRVGWRAGLALRPQPAPVMSLPSLSVVIPCLDAADTLPGQLAALAAQSYAGEWEVIVADNGPPERS